MGFGAGWAAFSRFIPPHFIQLSISLWRIYTSTLLAGSVPRLVSHWLAYRRNVLIGQRSPGWFVCK